MERRGARTPFRSALCTIGVGLASLAGAGAPHAGTITGVVRLAAGGVQPKMVPITIDQYVCGKEKEAENLVVSREGGVRDAVVSLQSPPPGAAWPTPHPAVRIDQKQCTFVPRVAVVPVGGALEFLNSDRLLHNLHSASRTNPTFNRAQPRGRIIPIVFKAPEIVRIDCDLHSWMRAWVVVAGHPFYAVTNERGEFALDEVPAGRYTLAIWHETLGSTTRDVVVENGTAKVVIEVAKP